MQWGTPVMLMIASRYGLKDKKQCDCFGSTLRICVLPFLSMKILSWAHNRMSATLSKIRLTTKYIFFPNI